MKTPTFSKSGWVRRAHDLAYPPEGYDKNTDNLCPYFWRCVLKVWPRVILIGLTCLMLVPTMWVYGPKDYLEETRTGKRIRTILGIAFMWMLFWITPVVARGMAGVEGDTTVLNFLWWWITGVGIMAGFAIAALLVVVAGAMLGEGWLWARAKSRRYFDQSGAPEKKTSSRGDSVLVSKVRAWYHEICPEIDWTE